MHIYIYLVAHTFIYCLFIYLLIYLLTHTGHPEFNFLART